MLIAIGIKKGRCGKSVVRRRRQPAHCARDATRGGRRGYQNARLCGCGTAISVRHCPRLTEFPVELQEQVAAERANAPALARMMDAMAADRAFNKAICG